jgi:hypothetical protein
MTARWRGGSGNTDTLATSKEHWAKLIEAFQPRHPKLAELMYISSKMDGYPM